MSNDIVGTRIGIYDVLYECEGKTNDGHKLYHVKCSKCGWETDMMKRSIKRATQCKHISVNGNYINYQVGWKNKRIASIFSGMKDRCYNSNCKDYSKYGGKGIKICDEWLNNSTLFELWSLDNGYSDQLTIDRIDGNKDYSPNNCRWIPLEDNARYKSTTSLITVNNETHTGRNWAKILGIGTNKINEYIRKHGLNNTIQFIERYLKNPGLKPKNKQSYYDLYMTIQN